MLLLDCCRGRIDDFLVPVEQDLFSPFTLEPIPSNPWKISAKAGNESEVIEIGLTASIFPRARDALGAAVQAVKNKKGQGLHIETFSNSGYLSGCVTATIGTSSAEGSAGARLFVSDFGYGEPPEKEGFDVFDDAWSLRIPAAKRFFASGGQYYISSLPKVLGFPVGGLLIRSDNAPALPGLLNRDLSSAVLGFLLEKLPSVMEIGQLRQYHSQLTRELMPGWDYLFSPDGTSFPGATILTPPFRFDEVLFKRFAQLHGVRTTSFFGNQSVLIPNHQGLEAGELNLLAALVRHSALLSRTS